MSDGLIAMAEHGQPCVVTPFTLMGAMTPVSLAAALVQQNAEALAGIALVQLVRPGAAVVYGAFTSNVDLRSGAPAFGTPENARATIAAGQLARRYGLPYRASNACASNAVDAQAAYESQMSIWSSVLGGANLVYHGAGWMEGGLTASFEKLVIDVEMLQMMAMTLAPSDVTRRRSPKGSMRSRAFGPAATSSALRTHSAATRPPSTRRSCPTGRATSHGSSRGEDRRRARDSRLAGGPRPVRTAAARPGRPRAPRRVRCRAQGHPPRRRHLTSAMSEVRATETESTATRLHAWLVETTFDDLPGDVRCAATRCLLDLAGTGAAGATTRLSHIVRDHTLHQFGAGPGAPGARLLFDGRTASPVGAALAGGMTIDSVDAHDGHVLTKGHAGAAVLPGLLALVDAADRPPSGRELLTLLVLGYEVAIRAGIALHATVPDYHTSGAWNGLGVAAVAGRLWALDEGRLRHALGIAEYHGPRSQMMRCIDHPTMLKDGSGWGAMAGVSAAYLAASGFTGAPALTVEHDRARRYWDDLGERWRILELYFKPYPVCRWAQPAIEAALQLRRVHGLAPEDVAEIEVFTFYEATRLDSREPATTEEAQYSLPFPVAVALLRGDFVPGDVAGEALTDQAVVELSRRIRLVEDTALSARFPAERFARVRARLRDGTVIESPTLPARGDAETPLSDAEITTKFHALAGAPLGSRADRLAELVVTIHETNDTAPLLDLLLSPLD